VRKIIVVSASVGLILVLSFGSLLSVAYYRRWQASRLLAAVRELHPGTTTEAQARALLKPFASYQVDPGRHYDVSNYELANVARWNPFRFALPWTLFSVNVEFAGGLVAGIIVTEMQEDHPHYPHPNSASVSICSNRIPSLFTAQFLPAHFNGYWEYSRSSGGLDSEGNWTGFNCCHARFIALDERATAAQLSRSLNFRLSCMTSFIRCKDDRQILP
jgi:hypothetical protein